MRRSLRIVSVLLLLFVGLFGGSYKIPAPSGSSGGAPTDADYLVGTANGSLSAERVVGGRALSLPAGFARVCPDVTNCTFVYDEFMTGSNSSGSVGALGWAVSGGTNTLQAPESGRPGIFRKATTTTINTVGTLEMRVGSGVVMSPAQDFDTTWIIRPAPTGDVTNYRLRVGLIDDCDGDTTNDGIYFEKAEGNTTFHRLTNAAATTDQDTGTTMTANTWYRLRIRRVGTDVFFSIDGAESAAVTTNIPTAALNVCLHIKNTAAADKTVDVDYADMLITGLSR